MPNDLTLRPATTNDLPNIIRLICDDELGVTRESFTDPLLRSYYQAFQEITEDKNQMLLVVESQNKVIGTCHLTFMPSLSSKGAKRLNLENIHVGKHFQGQGIGTWMIEKVIVLGQEKGCKIIQLTTNKKRVSAKAFYEKLGFTASHEGMKLYLDCS
ncbi:MAG TPA: GNAT family N-acetyltransferase [Alphaproteobacteria bacterium]|nr:GNAT family N-acetyltransferase [Alphaproteobacteria bacterium]